MMNIESITVSVIQYYIYFINKINFCRPNIHFLDKIVLKYLIIIE